MIHAARRLAEELDEGVVVCVLADGGWKYLSADFWDADDVEAVDGALRLVVVPEATRRALAEHARAEAPNEACGLLVLKDGVAERYVPRRERGRLARTASSSHDDPEVWFLEDEGYELAVVHSHVSSPPRPSRTDVENVGPLAGRPYLIYTLRTGELAAWRINDGSIEPAATVNDPFMEPECGSHWYRYSPACSVTVNVS